MDNKALAGVRVIEYADGIALSYCGKLLADMGASVIKVEKPKTGADMRGMGPFLNGEEDIEKSCVFFYNNTNKMSLTLDIERPEGQDVMKKLLEKADIFLKYGQPEWYEARGLGWDTLHALNPGLIVGSMTPYGESGPYKDYKANPLNVSHMSGMTTMYPLNSWPDLTRCPTMQGANFEQYDPGTMAAVGVMAALYHKNNTGEGQYMELSEVEAVLQISGTENTTYPVYGYSQDRLGGKLAQIGSEEAECEDGYVCPYFVTVPEYMRSAEMFGRQDWLEDGWIKDYATVLARMPEFRAEFLKWIQGKTRAEISDIAQSHKVSIGPVLTLREAMDMEQFKFREFFTDIEHPVWGEVKIISRPFIMHGTPISVDKAAPTLGEDNAAVLEEIGFDAAKIKQLEADGII